MTAIIRGCVTRIRYAILPLICLWVFTSGTALGQQTQTGDNPQRGFYPGGSYAVGDIETINTANGNLMLNIPLASLPTGRGGSAGPSVSLIYNSKLYNVSKEVPSREPGEGQEPTINNLIASETNGWRGGWQIKYPLYTISYENIRSDQCPNNSPFIWAVYVTFPDGGKHQFYPAGYDTDVNKGYSAIRADGWMTECVAGSEPGTYPHEYLQTTATMTYYSTDGSYMRLEVLHDNDSSEWNNHWVLYFPDGRKVLGEPDSAGNITYQRAYDRNNNYSEYQVMDGPNGEHAGGPVRLSDQLGRYITIEYVTPIQPYSATAVVTARGAYNAELRWTVNFKNIAVQKEYCSRYMPPSNVCYTDEVYETFAVVDNITLPSQSGGLTYQFGYNNASGGWGELNYVKLPSGAEVSYQYAEDGNSDIAWYRVLDNRPSKKTLKYLLEYDGASTQTSEEWNYAFDKQAGKSTVTSPDDGVSVEYQFTNVGDWRTKNKLVYRVEHPDGSVTERLWQSNGPAAISILKGGPVNLNPYAKTEFTSIRNAGGALSKTAVKDYSYDKNGNVTAVREYDWVDYASIQRDSDGRPLDVTQQPSLTSSVLKRVTSNTYYAQTPDASDASTIDADSYDQPGATRLQGALAATEVRDGAVIMSRTEYTYDDPATTGNLTLQRSWDSTKGALLGTPQDSVRLNDGNSISTSREYDDNTSDPSLRHGSLTLSVDSNGNRTKYTYGPVTAPNGDAFAGLYATSVVTAEGTSVQRTSSNVYDFSTGLATKVTDEDNDVSTSTTYDALGRTTLVEEADNFFDANNVSLERRTSIAYLDSLRRVDTRSDMNTTGDGKLISVQHYDELGRPRLSRTLEDSSAEDPADENAGIKVQKRYLIDKTAHASYSLTSNPYRAAHSYDAGVESTMGWTLSTTDKGGRMVRTETFGGAGLPAPFSASNPNTASTGAVVIDYDADSVTVTDQDGRRRRNVSDAFGRLTQVFEAPNAAGYNFQTLYSYDALGNVTGVAQGVQTRTFTYSSLSRLTSAMNPEVCQQGSQCVPVAGTYEYDANGNLKKKTDARGTAANYSYDGLNRVTACAYTGGTAEATAPVAYFYDSQALPAGAPAFSRGLSAGRLVAVTYGGGSLGSYFGGYDAAGRAKLSRQVTDTLTAEGVKTYSMAYDYYLDGAAKAETYPSGRVVETQYDAARRIAGVRNQGAGYYVGGDPGLANNPDVIKYGPHGAALSAKLGNGLWEHASFNTRLQPTQLGLGTANTNSNTLRLDYAYGTDDAHNNGNVRTQTVTLPGVSAVVQSYSYDALNRLSSAQEAGPQGWTQNYSYDRYGNRSLGAGTTSPDYSQAQLDPTTGLPIDPIGNPVFEGADNRIKSSAAGQGNYQYDVAGNLTREPITAQAYHSLAYDAENRQVKADGGAAAGGADYTYDGDGRRVRKVSGAVATVYVYDAAGRLLAEYGNAAPTSNGTRYVTTDTLGSPRVVTGSDGQVKERHDYMPFGEEVASSHGGRAGVQGYGVDQLRQKFTGYERDAETNLDYAQSRYFSSAQGRFTSPDSFMNSTHVSDPQSWNLYVYANNNPLKFEDPLGKKAKIVSHYDARTNTTYVTITASFAVYGAEGQGVSEDDKEKYANLVKSGIEKTYGKSFTIDGRNYVLSANITVQTVDNEADAKSSGADNIVELGTQNLEELHFGVDAVPAFAVTTGVKGENFDRLEVSINREGVDYEKTLAHEFGHLLGLPHTNTSKENYIPNSLYDQYLSENFANADFQPDDLKHILRYPRETYLNITELEGSNGRNLYYKRPSAVMKSRYPVLETRMADGRYPSASYSYRWAGQVKQ